jgi:hypothetical protein
MRLRRDNPYAAYGIAESLVYECEHVRLGDGLSDEDFGEHLTEALELLEMEPEASFEEEWEELKTRAIKLLDGPESSRTISNLKAKGDELGYALEALRRLGGELPYGPSEEVGTASAVRAAWDILNQDRTAISKASRLADFLRYVVFSALPERVKDPAYRDRFALMTKLIGAKYLERPLWLYDYGMLSLQNGKYREAARAFQSLRKGARFLEVPLDRAVWLVSFAKPLEPLAARLRVISISNDGKGWAKVEDPVGLTDRVSFSEKIFLASGIPTRPGAVLQAHLRIRPAGPRAEPLRPERDVRR